MGAILWLTSVETSEPIGIQAERIAFIERKPISEGNVVAIHLDVGREIRVIETLADVQSALSALNVGQAKVPTANSR